jgi:putative NADPH-quinone reductase
MRRADGSRFVQPGRSVRILVIDGHPDAGSYCDAVARAYVNGATASHDIRTIRVRELAFDPVLHGGFTTPTPLEPDLVEARAAIRWCEHLVVVTPNWWSSVPALFKGFIDRVFLPGFGVEYLDGFPYVRKLLTGRSARVIYTQNAPQWLVLLAREDLFWRGLRRAILGHCGFRPVRRTILAPMKATTPAQREGWLSAVHALGRSGR